jgi:hypothetical protein
VIYLLDANVLIRAHEDYYPLDGVPPFWDWLLQAAAAGHLKMPMEIHAEIAISTGDLGLWARDQSVMDSLVLQEEVDPTLLNQVLEQGYGPDLTETDIEKIGRDGFLVAYALAEVNSRTVITKENSKPSAQKGNRKIPDVCDAVGVQWKRDFPVFKQLGFKITG